MCIFVNIDIFRRIHNIVGFAKPLYSFILPVLMPIKCCYRFSIALVCHCLPYVVHVQTSSGVEH